MTTSDIKKFLKARYGIKALVNSTGTKNPYFIARIRPDGCGTAGSPFVYTQAFPWELGQRCLLAVYPDHPSLQDHWCGNVGPHSIGLLVREWAAVLAEDIKPA